MNGNQDFLTDEKRDNASKWERKQAHKKQARRVAKRHNIPEQDAAGFVEDMERFQNGWNDVQIDRCGDCGRMAGDGHGVKCVNNDSDPDSVSGGAWVELGKALAHTMADVSDDRPAHIHRMDTVDILLDYALENAQIEEDYWSKQKVFEISHGHWAPAWVNEEDYSEIPWYEDDDAVEPPTPIAVPFY